MDPLVLASRSPRRQVLLRFLVADFDVHGVPVLEEAPRALPTGPALETIAAKKALATSRKHPNAWVLAADTVVTFRGSLLNKPRSRSEARRNLDMLAGQDLAVWTGIALARRERRVDVDAACTKLHLERLDKQVVDDYLDRDVWEDKAGGIAMQDRGLGPRLRIVEGGWSNVVGLPLPEVAAMLKRNGIRCETPPDESWLRDHNPFDTA